MTTPTGFPELMIDIETMGMAPDGAVLAIGAVPFCIHKEKMTLAPREDWFSKRITLQANLDEGRTIWADIVEWWLWQSKEAQEALLLGPRYNDLQDLRCDFIEFVTLHRCEYVWAKPPTFDLAILSHLFGTTWPFRYNAQRDVRTLLSCAKVFGWNDVLDPQIDGTKHDALYDAHVQAVQVVRYMDRMYQNAGFNQRPEDRDFPEDFGNENGRYQNRCGLCDSFFIGNKGRVCCKKCNPR